MGIQAIGRGALFSRRGVHALPLLAVLLPAACDRQSLPAPSAVRIFKDGLGHEVRIPLPAQRIISLAPSNTEILFAIGAGPQVIGRDDFSDYPPDAVKLRKVGSGARLDLEAIVAQQPDLVLLAEIYSASHAKPLEELGLCVFLLPNPLTFDGLFANIRLLGQLTGRDAEAARLAGSLETRVKAVEDRRRGVKYRPSVFYELDSTDPIHPWTAGPGTFLHTLITLAGGENFAASETRAFPRISVETIIRGDPDIIILGDARSGVTVESVSRRAGWEELSAVKQGRVYAFDDDLASRPGPRLVEGLEVLAEMVGRVGMAGR